MRPTQHPQATGQAHPAGPLAARVALAACLALLCGLGLSACGGASVSDPVPKSTPDITPPTDTSAEKASIQTTSTSTTASKTTTSTSEAESSEASETPSEESSGTAGQGTAAGGTAAEEKEKAAGKEGTKESEAESSPTGGASAP
jgi:hypothetical protein